MGASCKHDWLLRADNRFRAPCPSGLENRKRALRSLDAALCLLWVTAGVERGRQQSLLARTRARLHVIVERYWWCLSLPASDASGLPYNAPNKGIRRLSSCVAAGVLTYHLSKSPNFRLHNPLFRPDRLHPGHVARRRSYALRGDCRLDQLGCAGAA